MHCCAVSPSTPNNNNNNIVFVLLLNIVKLPITPSHDTLNNIISDRDCQMDKLMLKSFHSWEEKNLWVKAEIDKSKIMLSHWKRTTYLQSKSFLFYKKKDWIDDFSLKKNLINALG